MAVIASAGQPAHVREGNWQVTTTVDMPNSPVKIPPVTISHCVTKEEAADPKKTLPQASSDERCQIEDHRVDGNKVTWKMSCPNDKVNGTGELVFTKDAYTGLIKMSTQGQEMTMKFDAKRLGDCK
jgi:Protein of unknown function (DUF3617)